MTAASDYARRSQRAPAPHEHAHLYAMGQTVRLKIEFPQGSRRPDIFQVVAKLPPIGEIPQYRIRNDAETHDRVATQDKLEPVVRGDGGARI